jgi:hypothetical protein
MKLEKRSTKETDELKKSLDDLPLALGLRGAGLGGLAGGALGGTGAWLASARKNRRKNVTKGVLLGLLGGGLAGGGAGVYAGLLGKGIGSLFNTAFFAPILNMAEILAPEKEKSMEKGGNEKVANGVLSKLLGRWNALPAYGRGAAYLAAGTGVSSAEYGASPYVPLLKGHDPTAWERVAAALLHSYGFSGMKLKGTSQGARLRAMGLALGTTPGLSLAVEGSSAARNSLKNTENVTGNTDRLVRDMQETGALGKAFVTGTPGYLPDGTKVEAPYSLPMAMQQIQDLTAGLTTAGRAVPTGIGTVLGYLLGGKATDVFTPTNDEAKRRRRAVLGQLAGAGLGGLGGYMAGGGKLPWS